MIRILHLEDDGPLREIVKIALTAADPHVEVQQFVSGEAALDYAEQNLASIDLFLLDIRVAGKLTGIEVAERLRELGTQRPIILTSAFRKPNDDVLRALDCRWMAKPWYLVEAPNVILPLARQR